MAAITFSTVNIKDGSAGDTATETFTDPNNSNRKGPVVALINLDGTLAQLPALGQQLAAASMPVVLTAAQIATLAAPVLGAGSSSIGSVTQPDPSAATGSLTADDAVAAMTTQPSGQVTFTAARTAASFLTASLSGCGGARFQVTGTGTFSLYRSMDGGTTYVRAGFVYAAAAGLVTAYTLGASETLVGVVNADGATHLMLVRTAGSGTWTARIQPCYGEPIVSVGNTVSTRPTGGTYTDKSGTITSGGSAQTVAAANTSRVGFFFQNLSTGDLWLNFGSAAAATQPSVKVPAGGSFDMGLLVSTQSISVFGATTSQAFAAREM